MVRSTLGFDLISSYDTSSVCASRDDSNVFLYISCSFPLTTVITQSVNVRRIKLREHVLTYSELKSDLQPKIEYKIVG